MRASLPKVTQDPDAAFAMLRQLDKWTQKTQNRIASKRADISSGRYFAPSDETPEWLAAPTQVPRSLEKPAPKRKSLDDLYKEYSE